MRNGTNIRLWHTCGDFRELCQCRAGARIHQTVPILNKHVPSPNIGSVAFQLYVLVQVRQRRIVCLGRESVSAQYSGLIFEGRNDTWQPWPCHHLRGITQIWVMAHCISTLALSRLSHTCQWQPPGVTRPTTLHLSTVTGLDEITRRARKGFKKV